MELKTFRIQAQAAWTGLSMEQMMDELRSEPAALATI
jgi:hypothetical protein